MGLSWVTYFADWKAQPGGIAGVPVRNYIDQSHEFALCLFVMAPLILSLATNGQRAWTFAFAVVMLGFYLDMRFVATSRTAFAYFPILVDPVCREISEPEACDLFPAACGRRRVRCPALIALFA
jgi:hypothetical protein